jgi:hypothetical protein
MPATRVDKPSQKTLSRRALMKRVLSLGVAAKMLYSLCAAADILCVFSLFSPKCLKCICKACSCDDNFFKADFDNLGRKKVRLKKMRTAALQEIESLNRYIKSFEKAQKKMVKRDVHFLKRFE